MRECDKAINILTKSGYKIVASLYHEGKCRHLFKAPEGMWAVSYLGITMEGIDESRAWFLFNNTKTTDDHIKNDHTQLEDIDATLQELEKNLKIIAVRLLSAVSDFVDKRIERLS